MSILLRLGALTLLTPCVLGSVASPAEKLSWLNDHNQVRCQANAKTMPALIWDQALEQVAQQWVNTHPLSHNAQRSSQYEALTRDSSAVVGENLAAGYTTYLLADAAWAAEKSDNPPGGHYTQMVWANTLRVGCARSNTTAPPYGNYYICDYYPAGNYVGQAAFTPAGGSNPNTDACLNQSRTTFLPTMTFPPGTSGANNGVLVYVNVNSGSGTPTAAQAQAANQPPEGPVYIGDAITIDIPHVNITDSASHYSTPISTATFAVAIGIIIAAVSSINM